MLVFCVLCIPGTADAPGSSRGATYVSLFNFCAAIENLVSMLSRNMEWGLRVFSYKKGNGLPTLVTLHCSNVQYSAIPWIRTNYQLTLGCLDGLSCPLFLLPHLPLSKYSSRIANRPTTYARTLFGYLKLARLTPRDTCCDDLRGKVA
jgi:hypothetical protein